MKDELTIDGKKMISLEKAGQVCGYSKEHIEELSRSGKVHGQPLNGALYVDEVELLRYRQNDAFGTIRYMEDNGPLKPEVEKPLTPPIKAPPVPPAVSESKPLAVKEQVDPALMTGFTVNQFGQKVVALAIALLIVFGVGNALNNPRFEYVTEDLSLFVYQSMNQLGDSYTDTLATVLYGMPTETYEKELTSTGVFEREAAEAESMVNSAHDPDTIPPFIILRGENPITIFVGEKYTDPGALVEDNKDSHVLYTVSPGVIETGVEGEHVVTISATDSDGNTTEALRVVIVRKLVEEEVSGSGPEIE